MQVTMNSRAGLVYGWLLAIIALFTLPHSAQSRQQAPTYFKDIAPIVLTKCAPCHKPGGPGPFQLLTYKDVANKAGFISYVTGIRYMPPWKADPAFRTFANEIRLTDQEIALISDWAKAGAPKGDSVPVKGQEAPQAFEAGRPPDLVLRYNQPYTIPGNNTEQFRIFVVPTGLTADRQVAAVHFVPSNKKLAHHARIMIDTTNRLRADNGIAVGDDSQMQRQRIRLYDYFWHGWVPGNNPVFYPRGFAKRLPKNSDLIVNMHYSPTPVDEVDNPEIHIWFAQGAVSREVKTYIMEENAIANQPFYIPADTTITFYMRSPVLSKDISMISLLPHMHVLGTSFKAFAITGTGDLIPLVKIDKWDFNWQMSYQFPQLIQIPQGSVIYAQATYDNTGANPQNPNSPPKGVSYGWGTYQEMMNFIFQYVDYLPDDEQITMR